MRLVWLATRFLPFLLTSARIDSNCVDPLYLEGSRLIGAGGTGVVYAKDDDDKVIKVAVSNTEATLASLANECAILKYLASQGVENIEQCVCSFDVDEESKLNNKDKQWIVLAPLFPSPSISSFDAFDDTSARAAATRAIASSLVQIIASNVASGDVQFLADKQTGRLMLIDFSEARHFNEPTPTFQDEALAKSFCSETVSLVASSDYNEFALGVVNGLSKLVAEHRHVSSFVSSLFVEQLAPLATDKQVSVKIIDLATKLAL